MQTLDEYLTELDWSRAELARRAGIDNGAANRAARGEPVTLRTVHRITRALGKALEREVAVTDIAGLNIGAGTGHDWRTVHNNSTKE